MNSLLAFVFVAFLALVSATSSPYGSNPYAITSVWFAKSCNGNPQAFEFFLPNACFGGSIMTCGEGGYNVSLYSHTNCTGSPVTEALPSQCVSPPGAGVSEISQCEPIPTTLPNMVHQAWYGQPGCAGPAIIGEAAMQGVCVPNEEQTAFLMTTCSATTHMVTTKTCLNSNCTRNCTTTTAPMGCINPQGGGPPFALWCFDSNGNLFANSTTGSTGSTTGSTGAPPATTGPPPATTGPPPATTGAPPATTGASKTTTGAAKTTTGAAKTTTGGPAPTTTAPAGTTSAKSGASQNQLLFAVVFLFCLALVL